MLGNPAGLISDLGKGVNSLYLEPFNKMMEDSKKDEAEQNILRAAFNGSL